MFGVILKTTNRSFQKGMTFCRSICVKKVMKLLAFTFEQSSYLRQLPDNRNKCLNRRYNMSAHVLLNLLHELRKRDKMRSLPSLINSMIHEHEC